MADQPERAEPPAVAIRVTRTGGIAGIGRGWRVETSGHAASLGWTRLVDACPWDEDVPAARAPGGADRFVWVIEVRAPEPARSAELPETAVRGPWRELVDRVTDEGERMR